LQRGLAGHGIESEVASSGDEALALLGELDKDHFDLILLDVMMPGADGWEVLQRMRAKENNTPAIFVTARDAVEERVKGLELGGDDYIIKPFDLRISPPRGLHQPRSPSAEPASPPPCSLAPSRTHPLDSISAERALNPPHFGLT
jgi:CheY-like chemotaxis protein